MEEHLERKWNMTPTQLALLTWSDFKKVMNKYKKLKHQQITKLFNSQWPTMERQHNWNRNSSNLCPLCENDIETKHHVFQCQGTTATDTRDITMGEIRGFLRSNSHPLIARQLERILNQFHNNYNIPLNQTQPMDFELEQKIQNVANTLISNGIDGFLNGLIPTNLIACQQEYFQTQSNKPPDICTWTQSLIELLHSHALNIWKKRSKFLHENISRSHENHIREEAYKTLLALRAYPSKLPASLRHLTKRTR